MQTKKINKSSESGRSMIEMIGVLAIIGVLSVGALSGYRMAMTRYKANELIDYAMRVGEAAAHHGTTQKTGSIPYTGGSSDNMCQLYLNDEQAPFNVSCYTADDSTSGLRVILRGNMTQDIVLYIRTRIGTNTESNPYIKYYAYPLCPTAGEGCFVRFYFKK